MKPRSVIIFRKMGTFSVVIAIRGFRQNDICVAANGVRQSGTPHAREEIAVSKVAIRLMSGTSLDGIDVAYLETNTTIRGPSLTFPYDDRMRELLVGRRGRQPAGVRRPCYRAPNSN